MRAEYPLLHQMTPRRTGSILLDAKSREDACTTSVR